MTNKLAWLALLPWLLFMECTGSNAANDNPSRSWIDISWDIRYLLFVDTATGRKENVLLARRNNALDRKYGRNYVYWDADELLPMSSIFETPEAPTIGLSLLIFDREGNVVSNDKRLQNMMGKLSSIEHLVLIDSNAQGEKPYNLLSWSQGIPGEMNFGPGPCTSLDDRRYQDRWKSGRYPGDFGCREWTAQLFNEEHPYIDVTTYSKRGNFIGQFVGWSRFKDAPKPVIGMNGKTWLCLHECPDGEKPGVIADISAWAGKHGYPLPEPPAYQPEYPNRNYQDDIDACLGE